MSHNKSIGLFLKTAQNNFFKMTLKKSTKKNHKKIFLFALILFFVGFSSAHAQAQNSNTEQKTVQEIRDEQELIHLQMADSLLKENRASQAFFYYSEFVELYPFSQRRFYALDKMAKIEEDRQNFFAALEIYKKLYAENILTEKGVEYLFQVSRLYERIGEYAKAKTNYEKIIQYYPDSFFARDARNALSLWDMLHEDRQENF